MTRAIDWVEVRLGGGLEVSAAVAWTLRFALPILSSVCFGFGMMLSRESNLTESEWVVVDDGMDQLPIN